MYERIKIDIKAQGKTTMYFFVNEFHYIFSALLGKSIPLIKKISTSLFEVHFMRQVCSAVAYYQL